MSLGAKLQAAHVKVNGKLGLQEGPIVIRKRSHTGPALVGQAYTTQAASDVTITSGAQVSWIKAHQVDGQGVLQVGDLRLTIPGSLVSEAQLTGAEVVYGGKTHSIVSRAPIEIASALVVRWDVVARVRE